MIKTFATGIGTVSPIGASVLQRVSEESIRCGFKPLFIGISNRQALDLPIGDNRIDFCVPFVAIPPEDIEEGITKLLDCAWSFTDEQDERRIHVVFIELNDYIEQLSEFNLTSVTALTNVVHNFSNNMTIINNMQTLTWKAIDLREIKQHSLDLEHKKYVSSVQIAESLYHALLAIACNKANRANKMITSGYYPEFGTLLDVYLADKHKLGRHDHADTVEELVGHLRSAIHPPRLSEIVKWYPKYVALFKLFEEEISKSPRPKWRNPFTAVDRGYTKEHIRNSVKHLLITPEEKKNEQ